MIDQLPVWMWWIIATCLIGFTGALLKIIVWFLGTFRDDNNKSWDLVRLEISNLTKGISDLVIVTKVHEERIENHKIRLHNHDESINELRKKV